MRPLWQRTRLGLASWLLLFDGGLLWLTAGYWPADVNEGLHLTAFLWLLLSLVGLVLNAAGLALHSPSVFRLLALVCGVVGVIVTFAFLGQQYFGLGTVYSVSDWLAVLAVSVVWSTMAKPTSG